MFRYPKKNYRQKFREIFAQIRDHRLYQKIMDLPMWIRITLAIFLFLFGIVGLLTPIPAGWVMIMASGVLIFGLHTVKKKSIRLFFMLRLHRIYEYIRFRIKK
jgi:uncharacterized membrane protein